MDLITFKNLPDTSTPLNAENLNLLQSNVEKAVNKRGITIGLSENFTTNVTTTYTPIKIPLNAIKAERDTDETFVIQSNGIKVTKAGYYVISANMMFNSSDTSQTIIGTMYRIRNNTNTFLSEGYALVIRTGYHVIGLTPMIAYLNENDIICLGVGGSRTGEIITAGSRFTYLTITEL